MMVGIVRLSFPLLLVAAVALEQDPPLGEYVEETWNELSCVEVRAARGYVLALCGFRD